MGQNRAMNLRTRSRRRRPTRAGFTVVEIMICVVVIGILGALAIPQFLKIRTRSQDSAVMNNLRQLGSASSQYFLQNGVSLANYSDLVGSDKYIKNLSVLASETYPEFYTQGVVITVTGVGGDRTLTYQP